MEKRKIKITIEYDGSAYCGWQTQKNGLSIQSHMEETFFLLTGEKIKLTASGRTDAGVNARGQVASFETDCDIPDEKIARAWNGKLNSDVRVLCSERADENFNARYSAKRKTYRYSFYVGETERPLYDKYNARILRVPDLCAMNKACEMLKGEHDFKCFLASGSAVKNTVRTIYDCFVKQEDEIYTLEVCGNGFLYNMVRIIAGTVIDIGLNRLSADKLASALDSGERKGLGKTMKASALVLYSVEY